MKQNNANKKNLITLLAVLGIGANFMFNAPSLSAQNTAENKKPGKDLMNLKHEKDSLVNANCDMFNIAQNKYYERLDKIYTMSLFFSNRELKELNKAFNPYFQKFAENNILSGEIGVEYKYIKLIFPMKANMPFGEFYYIIRKLNIPDEVLAQFGMTSVHGRIVGFKNAHKQNNFECYSDAFAGGLMNDGDLPADVPEYLEIYEQWYTNNLKIAKLQQEMQNENVK